MTMDTNGVIAMLNDLIETSRDGEQGFRTCAEGVNPNLKTPFEAAARHQHDNEYEAEPAANG
jgi:hypothetical protein